MDGETIDPIENTWSVQSDHVDCRTCGPLNRDTDSLFQEDWRYKDGWCKIIFNFKPINGYMDKRLLYSELWDSADGGCPTCHALGSGIRSSFPLEDFRDYVVFHLWLNGNTSKLKAILRWTDGRRSELEYFKTRENSHVSRALPVGSVVAGPRWLQIADRVNGWIKECVRHKNCDNAPKKQLPRRVLDLFPESRSEESSFIRLHETKGDRDHYVTLSHRWGIHQPLRSTSENVTQHLNAIPLKDLSVPFQEVVTITRALGIQFLWIDSLCIIQDDSPDWHRAASEMASIYQNAYLSIAITREYQNNESCWPLPDHVYISNGQWGTFAVRDHIQHLQPLQQPTVRYRLDRPDPAIFPLFSRGWVYQERLLPQRVLHIGNRELFWECNTEAHCECGTLSVKQVDPSQFPLLSKPEHLKALKYRTPHSEDAITQWHRVVTEFSCLDLTFRKDRLHAIAGIAAEMKAFRTGDYIHGLWTDTVLEDILWIPLRTTTDLLDHRDFPSWSWASAPSGVRYITANPRIKSFANVIIKNQNMESLPILQVSACMYQPREPTFAEGHISGFRDWVTKTISMTDTITTLHHPLDSVFYADYSQDVVLNLLYTYKLWCVPIILCQDQFLALVVYQRDTGENSFMRVGILQSSRQFAFTALDSFRDAMDSLASADRQTINII